MTKKDFIALANALIESRPQPHWDANKHAQFQSTVNSIVVMCRRSNPRFNEERFRSYINGECGPNGGKR